MAISNTSNNFLAKIFGRSNDKFRYRNQEEQAQPLPGQGVIPNPAAGGIQNFNLGNPAGNPTIPQRGNPTTPSVGSVPASTIQQPQAGAGMPGAEGAEAKASRYNLLQMMQPEPTRDTESEDIIKKRARMNAFGRGISALGGLAGMASGGDAPAIADLQTPYNMQQMQTLDTDYRNRLQDWTSRKFQTDAANNATLNREVDQTIDAENQMEQINLRSQQAAALSKQKSQEDLNKLMLELGIDPNAKDAGSQYLDKKSEADFNSLLEKSPEEQIKELKDLGIDPYAKDASTQYLEKRRQITDANLSNIKARTNYSNRAVGGGRTTNTNMPGKDQQVPNDVYRKGRDFMKSQLDKEIKDLSKDFASQQANAELIASKKKERDQLQSFKPGANPLLDEDIAAKGYELLDAEMAGEGGYGSEEGFDFGYPDSFEQGGGIAQPEAQAQLQGQPAPRPNYANLSEPERIQAMNKNKSNVLRNAQAIASLDLENPDPKIAQMVVGYAQELVDLGIFPDQESALENILNIAQTNAKK